MDLIFDGLLCSKSGLLPHLEPVVREVDGEVGERPDGVEGGKVDGAESVVGDVERLQPVDVLEGLVLQLLDL